MNGKKMKIDKSVQPSRNWVLSNKLIKMLEIKPAPNSDGMNVRGEDDKWYDIDIVFRAVFDKLENINLAPNKPLTEGVRPCPTCGSADRRISQPGIIIIQAMAFDLSKMAVCNNCGALYEYKK